MTTRLRPFARDAAPVLPDSAIREGIAGKKAAGGIPGPARLRKAAGQPLGVPGHVPVDAVGNGEIGTRVADLQTLPGRWVVRERGRLFRYGTEEFEASFEPAE
ncbi:MAG: hypothetical protein OYK82_05990 [Gammaproteobacteria bacterium]|nr:hypothetical protein [Gammaproteobacteria bacterium]